MYLGAIRRGAIVAAVSVGACCAMAATASAAELILFDGNNCTGDFRMTDRSISDLNQVGFDNRVNSFMAITGSWRFYRDANYQENNGPSFQIGPSGYTETCWSLNDASQGNFPNNRMSAVELLQDSPGPQPEGIAILYDFTNFGGQYRILTRSVQDFRQIGFDNDVESIRVVSGTWNFYRDAGFGAPPGRPSITLGPGDYANVANVPGYPQGHFPGDLMSSAEFALEGPPPPPPPPDPEPQPLQCAPGQVDANGQCLSCWEPFGNQPGSSVLNAAGNACECAPGYEWDNFGATNIGGTVFRDCEPVQSPAPPVCPGPYQYLDQGTGQCAFQCHQSTQPNLSTGECDCLPGTSEAGVLADGRRYCLASTVPEPPAQTVRYTAPATPFLVAANAAGFTFQTSADPGVTCNVQLATGRIEVEVVGPTVPQARSCIVTMMAGRLLAPGWRFEDYALVTLAGQAVPIGLTGILPFSIQVTVPPFQQAAVARVDSIDLLGPAGLTWQQALQ